MATSPQVDGGGGAPGAAVTAAIRDGVATGSGGIVNESPLTTTAVPDWKRELIERRKSLSKPTGNCGGVTSPGEQIHCMEIDGWMDW